MDRGWDLTRWWHPDRQKIALEHSADDAFLHFVVAGERAGEMWVDDTGSDGFFALVPSDFLELSARLLTEFVDRYR